MRPAGQAASVPAIVEAAFVMADGARLPYAVWRPTGPPRAVLLAIHGFGDYSGNAFELPAALFAAAGIAVYAYDQRGFGAAPHPGIWAGDDTMVADAAAVIRMLRARHPDLKLFVLGESMGGAVTLAGQATPGFPPVDATILLAPAVRGRASMSGLARAMIEIASRTIPLVGFQGSVPGIVASDNPAALERLSRDPLTLKFFRIDLVYGLIGLMDRALAAAPRAPGPLLVLYGGKDSIIPVAATRPLLAVLPVAAVVAYYPEGFHLLLRDQDRARVAQDVVAWLENPAAPLPSGADAAGRALRDEGSQGSMRE